MLSADNCPVSIMYIHIVKLLFDIKARTALSAKNSVTSLFEVECFTMKCLGL